MRSKEILFLKSLQNFSDLYNSRVDLVNGIYALPLSNVNYENHSKNIDNIPIKDEYISDETFFYLNIFDQNGIIFHSIKVTIDNKSILVNSVFIASKIINNQFIYKCFNWLDSLFLIDNIFIDKKSANNSFYAPLTFQIDNEKYILKERVLIGKKMILTAGPSIGVREKIYSADATVNGWNNQWNKYLYQFEQEFAEYIGVRYAIATSSCTGAMNIALSALDIKEGDEVIVPDITWVSTANAVMLVGATPIFADVDLDTWTIDPKSIESLINEKTKAIMPVHLYGHPAKMDEIMALASIHNLKIIEDAAPSIGAEFNEQKTGSFGDFSAFSFQGAKLIVTGEGGMLCTNDEDLYKRAYKIWDQGRVPGTFWIEELSSKYKMANIQAAIGLGQLQRNGLMVNKKRTINEWYYNRLKDVKGIKFFKESKFVKSIYWMSCILLDEESNITRDEFCSKLKDLNVDTRPVFPTISQYPYWTNKQKEQPISKFISDRAINLPSGVCLSKNEIDYICDQIIKILDQ